MNRGGYDSNLDADLRSQVDEKGHTRTDISTAEIEYFGDKISYNKTEDTLRILLININSIPSSGHPKLKSIMTALKANQVDIAGYTETNCCWHLMNSKDRWREMTKTWWECSKEVIAYNIKDIHSTSFQPGGTIISSINKPSHRIISTGRDETGLGRWSWTRYRGKHTVTTRVICAYRPCKPTSAGSNTAYSQQQRYFDIQDGETNDICPREALLRDLAAQITTWKETEHDQIILMMDCNQNVNSPAIRQWATNLGLRDAITSSHPGPFPPTYHRGSYPIDGIFISETINPICGRYLPFGEFPTDHRALWIDITYDNAFGFNIPKLHTPAARRLKSDDTVIRNKWITLYEQYLRQHKAHHRIFALESQALSQQFHYSEEAEFQKIANIRKQGLAYADKRCRKTFIGGIQYSDAFKQAELEIAVWSAALTKKLKGKYSNTKYRRLLRKTKLNNPLQLATADIIAGKVKAYANYYRIKKCDVEIRKTYLEQKAEAAAKERNTDLATVYKQMITQERSRTLGRNVRYALGKVHGGGITKIDVMRGQNRISLTSKEEIEQAVMDENDDKYRQTEQTPCMRDPLRTLLGRYGTTLACDQILNGTFIPPTNTDQYTKEFLTHLQRDNRAPPLATHLSTEVFQSGWRKMKEQTSSGISGLHFGHLKACAMNSFLANFEASYSNIPYVTGFSPLDWQKGVQIMIQKKNKDDLVTSLQTLVLLEADFNFNNKLLGKTTMQHAEKHNLIAKEQYGSRKGKSAILHAVHKRLTYDVIRMTRRPAAVASNDAKSCYDRILHSVAMLAYRRLGISSPPVECMLKSIQNMKHHIRTSYGDSAFTISSSGTLIPYQGSLQGNGASSTTWVVVSTPLLNMLRTADHGAHYISPISKEHSHSVGFSFVDDTDLKQFDMRDHKITTQEVMEEMQRAINRWEGGLKATGGAIRPDKSWVYPITFHFDDSGQWHYSNKDDIDFEFTVRDCDNARHILPQYSPHEAQETLGVYLAPDGNNNKQRQILRLKAETWKEHISVGHLNRQEAWYALDSTIYQSLKYPLPALTMTKEECTKIMAPVLAAGLPNSSICRNFPRNVLYGSKDESGMGKTNLYVEEGTSKIAIIKENLHLPNMTGELLRLLIEQCKVELGLGGNLFTNDYATFGHLLPLSLIQFTWKFCAEYNIRLQEDTTSNLTLRRLNDLYLMEIFGHSGHFFSKAELLKINRCRLHLRVTTLSDITTGYGNKINTLARQCIRDNTIPHFYLWPRQPRPGPASISLWRKALRRCFPNTQTGYMEHSLGAWTVPVTKEWKWFFNPTSNSIYQRFGNIWRIWKRSSSRGRIGMYPKFTRFNNGITLPPHSARATIQFDNNDGNIRLTGWYIDNHNLHEHPYTPRLRYNGWMMNSVTETQNSHPHILHAISTGTLRIVSDGSYDPITNTGTAAWIMEDESALHQLSGSVSVPGDKTSQNSHRSELTGILGGIIHVSNLCHQYGITSGNIQMGCDGKGAVDTSNDSYSTILTKRKHFDLLQAIHTAKSLSPLNWTFFHILGHQDKHTAFEDLPRNAQLNCIVDGLAKEQLAADIALPPTDPTTQHLPFENCTITWTNRYGQDIRICSHLKDTLATFIARETVRKHWIKKGKFTTRQESQIDWTLLHRAHKGLHPQRKIWLSKWISGFCGIGNTLYLYRYQLHTKCPRCNLDKESIDHVLKCPHQGAQSLWEQELLAIESWMHENQFPHDMVNIICQSLRSWQSNSAFLPIETDDPDLSHGAKEQDRIGWRSFLDGFLSKHWLLALRTKLLLLQSQRSALVLLSKLIKKLWELAHRMWEHRNDILHNDDSAIHQYDLLRLNIDLEREFLRGVETLPRRYYHLFTGTLESRLNDTPQRKRLWLTSVWAARDKHGTAQASRRNHISAHNFNQWRAKIYIPPETNATI